MRIHKQEWEVGNGEKVRVCVSDPTLNMIPKEEKDKDKEKKGGFLEQMVKSESLWEYLFHNG